MTLFKIYVFMQRYVYSFFYFINLMLALRRVKKRMKNCIFASILYFKYDIYLNINIHLCEVLKNLHTIIINYYYHKNVELKWNSRIFAELKLCHLNCKL